MKSIIYLDNNATTQVDPDVVQVMNRALIESYANPSSVHSFGLKALHEVEEARQEIAASINAEPCEIIFTASGSEANNLCIKGYCESNTDRRKHIITTKIEHPSVMNPCQSLERRGYEITYLPVNTEGFVNPESLRQEIRPDTILVSIMYANHEIGAIQPLSELAHICQSKNVCFHTDAVQSYLKVPLDVKQTPVSLASFSGHKVHAPKGIGFIYKRKNILLKQQIEGGNQEFRLRAGTENVPSILGLAKAAELYTSQDINRMKALQSFLIEELTQIQGCKLNGPSNLDLRLCSNVNISFNGMEGEMLLNALSEAGIYVSTGSACSSRNTRFSHVLEAIHCPIEYIYGNIRIGLSRYTNKDELISLLAQLQKILSQKKILQTIR